MKSFTYDCDRICFAFFGVGGGGGRLAAGACRVLVPGKGLNPCPLQWKCGVLTTGLPGKF